MSDWNVSLYQKFANDRQQPVYDLIHRIKSSSFKTILDVGCGSGMSTLPLKETYPGAAITGIDYSESMLHAAKEKDSTIRWEQRDCNYSFRDLGTFDLVFSNAALQWLTDQEASIGYMSEVVAPNGTFAIQIPMFAQLPLEFCVCQVIDSYPSGTFQEEAGPQCICHTPEVYYKEFAKHFSEIAMWKTEYFQIMESHDDLIEFYRSTRLRPYLDALGEAAGKEFIDKIRTEAKKCYPIQPNGKILFEFSRLFVIARHPHPANN